MRILFVHNIAPWDVRAGGGQRVHHEIAKSLVERGHEGHALFLGNPSEPGTPVPYPFSWAPEAPRFSNNLTSMAEATRRLLETWIPEVAYLSSPESAGVYRELPTRTGTLMTSHHPEPPDLLGSTTWRHPLRSALTLRKLQRPLMERWLLRNAERRSAVSAYGRETLYQRGYLEPGVPVAVIPNGVEESCFNGRTETGSRANFLFVGRMDDQKGVDVLLRAFSQINPASEHGAAWTLDLSGEGWRRERDERLGAELNLEGSIRFLGHGSPSVIKKAMAQAAVLVAPSRAENYPLILLEAMAAGLPVISTRVGGIGEMVGEGRSGLLVEPDDPEALATAMHRLRDDPPLRERLTAGGLDVARRHSWDRVADAIETELKLASELVS
ncbi:MAG: glycosyltransferase family 4 protein [Longimicrobiales bacterium]